jgi:hypothetical protein
MSPGTKHAENKALTMVEMVIATVVLTIVIGAIINIQIFCRLSFLNADHKSKVMNDASYISEHVAKFIANATGDPITPAASLTGAPAGLCDSALLVWTDSNAGGYLGAGDTQVLYCFNRSAATLRYYARYTVNGTPGHDMTSELIASGVTAFTPVVSGNTVNLTVTTCWKPFPNKYDGSCGTPNNPSMTLRTSVPLLSVSADSGS